MERQNGLALVLVALTGQLAYAAEPKLLGAIEGQVKNTAGVPQMGATVTLVSRYSRDLQRALTDAQGRFRFDALFPDNYGVRIAAASFVPAYRSNVAVKPGLDSFLTVQLANIFSSIELVYRPPGQTGLLTDDWKHVLRSSVGTRPVVRLVPLEQPATSTSATADNSMFSSTRGMVSVSAGEMAASSMNGQETDLGTAFALATSVFGHNQVEVSGNVGYSSGWGTPTAGFRTRYSRNSDDFLSPRVELTVRQASIRNVAGQAIMSGAASGAATPVLRTMSIKADERAQLGDSITFEYGALLEAVVFIDRLTFFSPYGRLSYDGRELGTLAVAYASGATPSALMTDSRTGMATFQDSLRGLGLFPRLSLQNGGVRVQGSDAAELGYRKEFGSYTIGAAAFIENVRDPAVAVAGLGGYADASDFLPDLSSDASIYNMGSYKSQGFMMTMERRIGEHWFAGLHYGAGDTLDPLRSYAPIDDPSEIRSRFGTVRRQWAALRAGGVIPKTGSFLSVSYGWSPNRGLAPSHAFLTQRYQPLMGVNFQVRQSLPAFGMPGRLEMNAEVRNLLAQGYVPIATVTGRNLVLMQFPRTVRGGLSFIF